MKNKNKNKYLKLLVKQVLVLRRHPCMTLEAHFSQYSKATNLTRPTFLQYV